MVRIRRCVGHALHDNLVHKNLPCSFRFLSRSAFSTQWHAEHALLSTCFAHPGSLGKAVQFTCLGIDLTDHIRPFRVVLFEGIQKAVFIAWRIASLCSVPLL